MFTWCILSLGIKWFVLHIPVMHPVSTNAIFFWWSSCALKVTFYSRFWQPCHLSCWKIWGTKAWHNDPSILVYFLFWPKESSFFLRLWIHTTGTVVVLVMWEMCRFHYSVSVLWMIQSVQGKLSLGMNAGESVLIVSLNALLYCHSMVLF